MHQLRATRFDVEQDVGGLDTVFGEARIFIELDQLHAQTAAGAVVTRHDEEDAIGKLHLGAHRHNG